jgi:hypothetical protein
VKKRQICFNLRVRFEYFLSRFAPQLAPTKLTMAPDRTRRALSIPWVSFPNRPPPFPEKNAKYSQKTLKKCSNTKTTRADSLNSSHQQNQRRRQIEPDECYRFHTSLVNFECSINENMLINSLYTVYF